MSNKIKYSILGILLVTMLAYWNNEIYEHRMHMGKAKELYAEGKYGASLDELKKANQFPFHIKTQKYISLMEVKKQNDMHAYKMKLEKKREVLEDYTQWVEGVVFAQTTNGFSTYEENKDHAAMSNLFYKLNFEAQNEKIGLSEDLTNMHEFLIKYLNTNQLAYSNWENGNDLEAEKLRQEAISLHTDFMMEYNVLSKVVCGGSQELGHHLY